jgi:uncharacterized membrane protein YkoI
VLSLVLALARPVAADVDHERARKAFEAGEIVSLASILATVDRTQKGQVVEVELEREAGRWVYEVELLTPDGRVIELLYDGATGARREPEP